METSSYATKTSLPFVTVGTPLVLSVEWKQSCAKFKLDIWKQISRLLLCEDSSSIARNSPEMGTILALIKESVFQVGLSLEFCRLLTVRVVKKDGSPLFTPYWKRIRTGAVVSNRPAATPNSKLHPSLAQMLSCQRTETGIPVKDLDLGASVPDDKSLSIGEDTT